MPVIPVPISVWFGFLIWIAEKVEAVAWRLGKLAGDLQDVWLLGPHLANPLYEVRDWLFDAARWVRDFDRDIRQWLGYLSDIINGWSFMRLLYWVSDEFRQIQTDAQNWISEKLYAISGNFWLLVNQPAFLIRAFIGEISSWFGQFLDNPAHFISDKLRFWYWWFAEFSADPIHAIIMWLGQRLWWFRRLTDDVSSFIREALTPRYWWFGLFLDDPIAFVREFIIRMNPRLHGFILDPERWIKEKIAEMLRLPYEFVDNPEHYIALLVLQNLKRLAERIGPQFEEIIIDLVLHFI